MVISAILTVVAGAQVVVTQPGYVQGLVDYGGRSPAQAGYLLSTEMTAFALATICMTLFVGRLPSRPMVGVALIVLIAGNMLCAAAGASALLPLGRILVGISAGILVPLGFSAIAQTSNPDRYFGAMIAAVLLYGALVLGLLPALFAAGGLAALFLVYGMVGALALPILRWFPEPPEAHSTTVAKAYELRLDALRVRALGGMLLYFTAIGAFWSYTSLIAQSAGVSNASIARALSASQMAGIIGALVPVAVGTALGRTRPLGIGVAAAIVPMALMMGPFGASAFLAMIVSYNFGWNLTHPYLLGTAYSSDREQ